MTKDKSIIFLFAMLIVSIITVYAPHLNNSLVFDDHPQIEENPFVRGEVPFSNAFTQGVWNYKKTDVNCINRYYRPLFSLAHRVAYKIGNGAPWAFHLLNLLLHLVVVFLAVAALRKLDFPPSEALAATALFSLSPLAGEAVYWASCTSELLLQIGLLIAFIATLANYRARQGRRVFYGVGAILGTLIGLLSKETAVVIAPILTLEVLRHPREERFGRLLNMAPLWIVTLIYLWLRSRFVSSDLGPFLPDVLKNIGQFGLALGWFGKQFLVPYPLSTAHFFPLSPSPLYIFTGIAILLVLSAAVAFSIYYKSEIIFWIGWIVLPLAVTQIPLLYTYQSFVGTPIAERYMYIPLIPLFAVVVSLYNKYIYGRVGGKHSKIVAVSICIILSIISGGMTYSYGSVFKNDDSYFQRAYAYNKDSSFVLSWLAILETRHNRYENALNILEKVKKIDPEMPYLDTITGMVLYKLGKFKEAAEVYEHSIKKYPSELGMHLWLGRAYLRLGKIDDAIKNFEIELQKDPYNVEAMEKIGICLYQKNDVSGALSAWMNALKIKETPSVHFDLGMAYMAAGNKYKAEKHLRRFLEISGPGQSSQRNQALKWLGDLHS